MGQLKWRLACIAVSLFSFTSCLLFSGFLLLAPLNFCGLCGYIAACGWLSMFGWTFSFLHNAPFFGLSNSWLLCWCWGHWSSRWAIRIYLRSLLFLFFNRMPLNTLMDSHTYFYNWAKDID